jgi:hypothetical protein
MNANEISFGIEIETHVPAGATPIGHYHAGVQVPWLPIGWKAERDGSIRCRYPREQCEFISPVLRGAEGIKQVIEAVKAIKAHGGRVNESCGIHITLSWNGDAAATERLVTLVANFEKAIFASTGTKKREQGRYCNGVQRHGNAQQVVRQAGYDRYHVLNLTHLQNGRPRIEIRAFAGSLNVVKIVGYIRLCLGLAERALKAKRTTNFVAKKPVETSPIHRGGEGQTELTRLFYQLGWIKGRTQYVYGDVTAEGAPTHRAIKKQLMGLAKKYDGEG